MPNWIGPVAWAWLIVVGVLILTPIGPICIACDQHVLTRMDYILGAISIVLGLSGLGTQFANGRETEGTERS